MSSESSSTTDTKVNPLAALLLGVSFVLAFTGVVYLLMQYTAPDEAKAAEKYSMQKAGGVGAVLLRSDAPQEYMEGSTKASATKTATGQSPDVANMYAGEPTNIGPAASSGISASSAVILADMGTSPARIQMPKVQAMTSTTGDVMSDIRQATKGDGQIRPVYVNGAKVSDDYVKAAMFENQDFMYHLQTPQLSMPHLQDPSNVPQKSMFRKMTYPLVYSNWGALGTDIIGNSNDTRVTVSFTGGRPPSNA